jgi:hypothetical protein
MYYVDESLWVDHLKDSDAVLKQMKYNCYNKMTNEVVDFVAQQQMNIAQLENNKLENN